MYRHILYLTSLILILLASSQVVMADAFLQDEGPDGIVSVLAIHYDSKTPKSHDWLPYAGPNEASGYPGGDAMRVEPDPNTNNSFGGLCGMHYNIYLNRAGIYYVWVLGWGPDVGGDSCHVAIDDVQLNNLTGFGQNYSWGNTMGFEGDLAKINIAEAGEHTLSINGREGFAVIEKCILTTNPDFIPTQDIDLRPDGTEPAESPRGPAAAPTKAYDPSPFDLITGVTDTPTLTWNAGQGATQHDVYFGTDANAVTQADKNSPLYKDTVTDATYAPGVLLWDTTYYWRIDEVSGSVVKGNTWSFTTADYLIAEDFERYGVTNVDWDNGTPPMVWDVWLDGFDNADNGSQLGSNNEPYLEIDTPYGGFKSLPLLYNNTITGSSIVTRTWDTPQDWTQYNLKSFSMWMIGNQENSAETLYVIVSDDSNEVTIPHPDPNALLNPFWTEFFFALSDISDAGVNLSAIKKLTIGIGDGIAGGTGEVLLDDIRIYQPIPRPDVKRHPYDLDGSGVVDNADVDLLEQAFGHEFMDPTTGDYGVYIEAEEGLITGMTTYDDPAASGGQYIGTEWGQGNAAGGPNGNSRVTWTFTTDTAGTYRVAYKNARFPSYPYNVNVGKQGYLMMDYDNSLVTNAGLHSSGWILDNIPNINELTWDWVGSPAVFTLEAGEHVLEFERRMAGSKIDALLITPISLDIISLEPQEADVNGDGVVDDLDRTLITEALGEEVLWP